MHSFGRAQRVRKSSDYRRIQSTAKRVTTKHFVLLVAAANAGNAARVDAPARLGLVVTRRIGGAVERNRIKRLCRECFRQWPGLLPSAVELVIVARAGAGTLKLANVVEEIQGVARLLFRRGQEALQKGALYRERP